MLLVLAIALAAILLLLFIWFAGRKDRDLAMRRVAIALAAILWLLFIALASVSIFVGEDLTPFEMDSFRALQAILGVSGLVFTLIATKPFRKNFWQWVSPRPGSLPFVGWIAVAGPVFIGALFAPDSNVRFAFAIAFGLIAFLIGIASALPWAISQRVKTEDILKVAAMTDSHTAERAESVDKTSAEALSRTTSAHAPDRPTS